MQALRDIHETRRGAMVIATTLHTGWIQPAHCDRVTSGNAAGTGFVFWPARLRSLGPPVRGTRHFYGAMQFFEATTSTQIGKRLSRPQGQWRRYRPPPLFLSLPPILGPIYKRREDDRRNKLLAASPGERNLAGCGCARRSHLRVPHRYSGRRERSGRMDSNECIARHTEDAFGCATRFSSPLATL